MKNVTKKLTAWLCCMALLVTLLPAVAVPAFAAEGTALTDTSGDLAEGSYYLTDNLTLDGSLGVKSDVTIDLNGYTITQPEGLEKSVFVISADGHLTLKDSAGNGKVQFTTTTEGAAGVANKGEFTLESGTLTGWKREGAGGMVYLYGGATFTMNGGLLTGCEGQYGCVIRANGAGATVNINGGSITGNNTISADYSIVDLRGDANGTCKLNITGGTIKGNTNCGGAFTSAGKEIYCRDTEVTITGGDLGYVHSLLNKLTTGDKMAISGKPVIQSVYVKNPSATPCTITKLVEGASITTNGTEFETDDTVVLKGSTYVYGVKAPESVDALDFSTSNSIQLGADVTTGGISLTKAGSYVLDLNGKTITGTKAPYITIGNGVTLTIRDSAKGGQIRGLSSAAAMLKVTAGGKLVLESGTLTGHTNSGHGGAVYNAGTFEMTGGTISNNTAEYAGAILMAKGSVTTISGGTITGNRATYRGGAIGTPDSTVADQALQPVLNVTGGEIMYNYADDNSATFYIYTSKVNISGGKMGHGGKLNATTGVYEDGDGAGDLWIRGSVLTITGGYMDDLATRPDTNFNFTLNISGNPVIEAAYPTMTVGNFTTTATIGTLTSGAYIKVASGGEIPVAADAQNVYVTSGSKGYFYRCATDNVDDAVTTTDAITNVTIQPGASETGRNFNWFSTSDAAGYVTYAKASELVNGAMPANATRVAATRDASLKPGYYHNRASIVGLEPGNEYAYQLSNGNDASKVFTFEVEQKSDTFNFVFVGDPQLGQPHIPIARQVEGWTRTLDQITTDPTFAGVNLVVSAGDQITSADANDDGVSNSTMYNGFTNHEELASLTFASTLGNHDSWTRGEHFQQFNNPGYMINPATGEYYGVTKNGGKVNSADYWFVYNSVLFINLNVNDFAATSANHTAAQRASNKQNAEYHLEFIDKVLELNEDNEDIQWKVVVYHESPYGSSYHGNYTQDSAGKYTDRPEQNAFIDMREYLLPGIYERDFDVVLSGHDHTYTRSHILKHEAVSTNGLYYGNETITPFENASGNGYYTYADGTTTPTFVNWTDANGTVHTDKKTASLPVKVTNPDGVLHITAASSSGSTNNAATFEHPAVAVVHSGREPKRQAILVEVTPTSLTFTNYGLGTAGEDYVLADNVIDTFTIERVEVKTGSVTVEQPEHGTVSVDKTEGAYGETVTVTTKADSGYKLKEVRVDGVAIKGKTFTIDGDHVVTAVFVERGNEPLRGFFSLEVVNRIQVDGAWVDICRWVWTPYED